MREPTKSQHTEIWTLERTQLSRGLSSQFCVKRKNDWGTFFHGGEKLDFELPINDGLPVKLNIYYTTGIFHMLNKTQEDWD